jgi:hypothetical protein
MTDRELEHRLRAFYAAEIGEGETAPADLRQSIATIPATAPAPLRPLGRRRNFTLLAVAAVLLVGGALAAGSGLLRLTSVVPPTPSEALLATSVPSTSETPTETASATASPSPTPLSLDLTWTNIPLDSKVGILSALFERREQSPRLAWIGDRFALADVKSGAVRTSTDGQDWEVPQPGDAAQGYVDLLRGSFASRQDSAVAWWNPQEEAQCGTCTNQPPITARDVVQIVRPPAPPTSTTPFKGRIESMGIGPRGIVAQVHSDLDWEAWVTKRLGLRTNNDWTCCVTDVTFKDGVLRIKLSNRPTLKVVWADEGLEPGDYQDRGFGWYSPDGVKWTAMAPNPNADYGSSLPTGFGHVVGVSDGFIATGESPDGTCPDPDGSCAAMWYSSDGLTWRLLGVAPFEPRQLLPWSGGVLVTDGQGHAELWTSGGSAQLPMAAQVHGTVATGPLGLVSLGDGQVLVSRDGIDDKVSSIPDQMADPANGGGGSTVVAVGDRTVLVLESARVRDFTMTQSLWLGTFGP